MHNRTAPRMILLLAVTTLCAMTPAFASGGDEPAAADSILFRPDVERLFVEAMRHFQAERFDSAAVMFDAIVKDMPRSHRETGAYIMGAKALYRAGGFRESIRFLKDLLDIYPQSSYADDAHYTLGLNYLRLRRYEDAAEEFLTVREATSDRRLSIRSERLLANVAAERLAAGELQLLANDAKTAEMKALLNLRLAEILFRNGDARAAQDLLLAVSTMNPAIPYVGEALRFLENVRKGGGIKIGVVLPLMMRSEKAGMQELGAEFLDGIRLAAEEHNATAITKVTLEVRDTERDAAIAAQLVGELARDEKVAAILGPVLSNEVLASAGIANERGVPLITPTATSNGIAAIGPFVFQANPDYRTRGRAAALFSVEQLRARRVAVLSPGDAIGRQTSEAFIEEVVAAGVEVVDVQWYPPGTTDIRSQLMAIRTKAFAHLEIVTMDFSSRPPQTELNKLLRLGISKKVLDSLMQSGIVIEVEALLGADGRRIADSLRLPVSVASLRVDSLAYPVPNIDVLFLPITSPEEIAVVSSQVRFVNFQSSLVGSGDWNDLTELEENRQYADGVYFATDSYYDPAGQGIREFAAKLQRSGRQRSPSLNTMFGYDVCRVLCSVVAQGATLRREIAAALPEVRRFEGLHSILSFSAGRVNSYLTMLQFKNRAIRKVGEVDLSGR